MSSELVRDPLAFAEDKGRPIVPVELNDLSLGLYKSYSLIEEDDYKSTSDSEQTRNLDAIVGLDDNPFAEGLENETAVDQLAPIDDRIQYVLKLHVVEIKQTINLVTLGGIGVTVAGAVTTA
ncbi:hypothetical protein PPTG_12949 [Phytophthora nicotianae INRA-310]|uniref:Uncharacterized protein n=1 Tax=Phytophthora nicotianae (strain INRA-310) TaxID=761204 RepID=W2Q1I3_PHYN3|nr:hypothetical protein PPTG_12949 [Phytophthora nicotianae INRA-310]ETN06977.1 hypothetical protein PPTG_12949 [Phytophthora nicotianae INRA-310]